MKKNMLKMKKNMLIHIYNKILKYNINHNFFRELNVKNHFLIYKKEVRFNEYVKSLIKK